MSSRKPVVQIAIILGSTRPGRRVGDVAQWVAEAAGRHPAVTAGEASVELVDIADYGLPLLDEILEWSRALRPLHTAAGAGS